MEYKKGLIGMLIIVNILLSCYLIFLDATNKEGICLTGQGCKIVRESSFSQLFGIPLAWFGLLSFTFLLIIYLLDHNNKIPKEIFPVIALIGALFAIYFLSIQILVIKALCSTCLLTDSIAIILCILVWHDYNKHNKNKRSIKH